MIVCISTVAARLDSAKALAAELNTLDVVTHINVDEPLSGTSWTNYQKALKLGAAMYKPPDDEWLLNLDDDVELCPDFARHARIALMHAPGDIASLLYTQRSINSMKAIHAGAHWIRSPFYVQGAGFAVRTSLCAEALAWVDKYVKPDFKSGDQRLMMWVAATGRFSYSLVPSLIEHRADLPSIMYPRAPDGSRKAAWFQADPSGVKWSSRWVPAYEDSRERHLGAQWKRGALLIDPRKENSGKVEQTVDAALKG